MSEINRKKEDAKMGIKAGWDDGVLRMITEDINSETENDFLIRDVKRLLVSKKDGWEVSQGLQRD